MDETTGSAVTFTDWAFDAGSSSFCSATLEVLGLTMKSACVEGSVTGAESPGTVTLTGWILTVALASYVFVTRVEIA